jgi:hypothetical protein
MLEQEGDMLTEPYPDYLLPKRLHPLLWIAGGLIFCGQFTILQLAGVGVDAEAGLRHLSAWLTLADYEWSAPSKVFIPSRDAISSPVPVYLAIATVGSLPLFVLSALRQRRFSELVLLLCIPFSVTAALFALVAMQGSLFLGHEILPFDLNTASVADSPLEVFLGVNLPLVIYGVLFCLSLFLGMARIVTMLGNRHRVAREKRELADGTTIRSHAEDDKQHPGARG